jgi:hypothetical protein
MGEEEGNIGMMEYWNTGRLGRWNTGTLESWNSEFTMIPVFHYSNLILGSHKERYVKFI